MNKLTPMEFEHVSVDHALYRSVIAIEPTYKYLATTWNKHHQDTSTSKFKAT
jgi:hypothetical protein